MDTSDPQTQANANQTPQTSQPKLTQSRPQQQQLTQQQPQQLPQQSQHHHHHHHHNHPQQHRQPPPHAQAQQQQPSAQQHPQHIQQPQPPAQAQIHQQPAHPATHQHAQSTGYAMPFTYGTHYPQRYQQPHQYSNIPYNSAVPSYFSPSPYSAWQATNFPPASAAAPPSQGIPTTPHVAPPPLAKREKRIAIIRDPNTNKELDLKEMADSEPSAKSSAAKAPTTQSSKLETKTNPITSVDTNTATNPVTTSSSNDRTNTSSPPSVSNILLRKVSEDTESDKRQAAATTITITPTVTTTVASTKVTTSPAAAKPVAMPIKPTPVAIKPIEEVPTKINNINGSIKPEEEKKPVATIKKDLEVVEEKPTDCDTPSPEPAAVDASTEETINDNSDSTEAKSETEEKVSLHYEPWQYNPLSNRTGKKKYDRQFLLDVCEKICKLAVFDEDKRDDSMDNYVFTQVDVFAPSFSRNLPYLANNRQNDASRRTNNQNFINRSGSGQDKPRARIIAPAPSLTQEVELKTVANPWRPGKEVKEETAPDVKQVEELKKSFRSILNKLTPNNFTNLSAAVTALDINTETKLGEVIDIVFAKALAEPGYCVLYGQMCSHLKKITAGTTNFGNTLLRRCQNQFQSDIYSGLNLDDRKKQIEEESDTAVKKQMNEELYEEMYRCRMRGLGLIKFIGELYKIEMLNDAIMFDCMKRLLKDTSEESLECLCDLLVTIGEKLDTSTQKTLKEERKAQKGQSKTNVYQAGRSMASVVGSSNAQQQTQNAVPEAITTLDDIFARLHKIRKDKDLPISLRIRFKLLDVCELRDKENWKSKKAKDDPKTIEEIRTAHMEKLENEKNKLNQARGFGGGGRRHLGHAGGSSSQISSLANESGNRGSVSNMHSSASSHAICDHSLDDKMRQNHSDSYDTSRQHQQSTKDVLERFKALSSSSSDQKRLAPLRPTSTLRMSTTASRPSGAGENSIQ